MERDYLGALGNRRSPETESSHPPRLPDALVRAQLERILGSDLFARSERLSRFLRFVVERSLDGSGGELKEQVLATELYDRGAEFDTGADPVVRVDARRLRDKLREYYAAAVNDAVIISLPKGSYRPVFQLNQDVPASATPAPATIEFARTAPRSASSWRWIVAAMAVTLFASATTWFLRNQPFHPQLRVAPLSSLPGVEGPPTLSPDGNFVAFSWSSPEILGPADIWIKAVDSEDRRRLTETPFDSESNPAWSPDGREIAFIRSRQGSPGGVFVCSILGTAERKVSDSGTHVGWARDSKSVLIRDRESPHRPYGIFQIFLATLEKRRLTQAPTGIGDARFDLSPDGGTLAWIRYERPGIGDIFVTPVKGGEPRRLTEWSSTLGGLAWTPDGTEIVFSAEQDGVRRLFRIKADRSQPGIGLPLEGIPAEADHPAMSRKGPGGPARLAFQSVSWDTDLQMVDLAVSPAGGALPARPFLPSTRIEGSARFSPDGNRVAFVSYRSGPGEIWVADLDASGLRRLTDLRGTETVVGSWSPDGRRITFTAAVDGNSDIYAVADDGGGFLRLTTEPAMDILPSYSADGRWIYFSRNLTGADFRAWRVPAGGGPSVQITQRGGFQPQESPDGQDLYYLDGPRAVSGIVAPSILIKRPLGGGPEVSVLANVPAFAWCITDKGILFVTREANHDAVDLYEFRSGMVARVGRMSFRLPGSVSHMTFSRDGKRALGTRLVRDDTDLMFIDGFR